MIPWAKGWLASQALDASLIGPSFGLNKRKYYRNFGTSRLDFLFEDVAARLARFTFCEADYRETGEIEFDRAISAWAAKKGIFDRRSFIVEVGGMWGGYPAIRNARSFLSAKLLNSQDALSNVHHVSSQLDRNKLFVAVHMRTAANEFAAIDETSNVRGRFNILVPGDWYLKVCEEITAAFPGKVQFWFFTDKGGPAYQEAIRRFNPEQNSPRGLTECSDLLLLAKADLRVCSVSSYSLVANFLSEGPYLWYEPQLTLRDGLYSLWGHEEAQRAAASLTSEASSFLTALDESDPLRSGDSPAYLGHPMRAGDHLPTELVTHLQQVLARRDRRINLIDYGCVPERLR